MDTATQDNVVIPRVVPRMPVSGDITFEDFLDLAPDGVQADLLDGVMYMASPDNIDAADLNSWLAGVLVPFVEAQDLGKIYLSRVAYRLSSKRGPEPDIGFVCKARLGLRRRGFIEGRPDLAIEIVSPDSNDPGSVERDYVLKRATFEAAGVVEYWILDPDEGRAMFLRLIDGKYMEVLPTNHIFRSEVLPGLELDARWLTTPDRPSAYSVLRNLLS